MTVRAVKTLKNCNLILAEDTRHSAILLRHYGIESKMMPYHLHNEHSVTPKVIGLLKLGENIGIISDAGTPGISDAGYLLVRECVKEGIEVICLPGPTAFVPALITSGFPTNEFLFVGFLPQKKGRQKKLQQLAAEPRTVILYESPNRLVKLLHELKLHFGAERRASVSREISKIHEETVRGTVNELYTHFSGSTVKGEIAVVLGPLGA
jgi:16S rRNA (cytidine1402-2'-O)-methyltransferase